MTTNETIALFDQYVIANYGRSPIVAVRGEGSWLWDAEGKKYLDLFPGWGVDGIGHCHPRVVAAIQQQAATLLHVANVPFYMEQQGRLAELLSTRGFGGQSFFCNSGAEANEAAIKLARLAGGEGKYKIITALDSFHGRTLGAVAATGQAKYQDPFRPLIPGFMHVPFGDIDAVAEEIDDETCAVMVEPIQGEGGVNVPPDDYLPRLRELCDERGILLILDEVQTGVGRLGKWFGHQVWGIEPDIMSLAKALGGGLAIGAMVAKPEVAKLLVPGTHASTFGGNPMACAAGIATFEAIEAEGLLANAARIGEQIKTRAAAWQQQLDFIADIRGLGCMIGIELTKPGADIVAACVERGLLINCTHGTVLRFLPSMAATEAEIGQGLDTLGSVLTEA